MSADEDPFLEERTLAGDDGQPEAPSVVLPGAGATLAQGMGPSVGAVNPILPPPFVSADEGGTNPDNLAGRIEQTLAEDGRFTSLLGGLSFVTDDGGHVTLSGALPNSAFTPSLLATVRAIPGVTQVTDETH